jgi:phosphoglycolate phosphatase
MNLIFDFDGTICDSSNELLNIANRYLKENNLPQFSLQNVRSEGIEKLFKKIKFPKYKIPFFVVRGRRQINTKIPHLKSFKGIKRVLKRLTAKHSLGILTSNSEENVKKFLKSNNMSSIFGYVVSENNLFGKDRSLKKIIKKYKMDPKTTVYIGDEVRDIKAAKNAGIKSVAVTWGIESKKILKSAKPDGIVENINNLEGTIDSLQA